jgi:hypothetical protein
MSGQRLTQSEYALQQIVMLFGELLTQLKEARLTHTYHVVSSAKNNSVRAEWLRQSGHASSEPSETPRWRITPRTALI